MADAKSTFFGRSYIIARFISSIYGLLRTGTWLCDFKASFRLDKPDSLPENNQPPVWLTSPPLFRPDRMRDSHPISNSILPFYKHQTKSWVIQVLPTPMNEHMTIESRSEVADTFVHTDVLSKTMNPMVSRVFGLRTAYWDITFRSPVHHRGSWSLQGPLRIDSAEQLVENNRKWEVSAPYMVMVSRQASADATTG
jgi:hypothetical protein